LLADADVDALSGFLGIFSPRCEHVIDFLPGVAPYESTMVVEFFPSGDSVRMVVTLDPMHTDEFTRMSTLGFTSQLAKLDKRFQ
jgi:hypothetical protein